MKTFHWLIVVSIGALLSFGVYKLAAEKNALAKETRGLSAELNALNEEKKTLAEELNYLENKENLLKQLKAKFNYRKPDENMIIIVP